MTRRQCRASRATVTPGPRVPLFSSTLFVFFGVFIFLSKPFSSFCPNGSELQMGSNGSKGSRLHSGCSFLHMLLYIDTHLPNNQPTIFTLILITNNTNGGITQKFFLQVGRSSKRLSEGFSPSHGIAQVGYSSHLTHPSPTSSYPAHECTQGFGPFATVF